MATLKKVGGGVAGGAGGAIFGAVAGGTVGSIFGPVGTIVGAKVGAWVVGAAGACAGYEDPKKGVHLLQHNAVHAIKHKLGG